MDRVRWSLYSQLFVDSAFFFYVEALKELKLSLRLVQYLSSTGILARRLLKAVAAQTCW